MAVMKTRSVYALYNEHDSDDDVPVMAELCRCNSLSQPVHSTNVHKKNIKMAHSLVQLRNQSLSFDSCLSLCSMNDSYSPDCELCVLEHFNRFGFHPERKDTTLGSYQSLCQEPTSEINPNSSNILKNIKSSHMNKKPKSPLMLHHQAGHHSSKSRHSHHSSAVKNRSAQLDKTDCELITWTKEKSIRSPLSSAFSVPRRLIKSFTNLVRADEKCASDAVNPILSGYRNSSLKTTRSLENKMEFRKVQFDTHNLNNYLGSWKHGQEKSVENLSRLSLQDIVEEDSRAAIVLDENIQIYPVSTEEFLKKHVRKISTLETVREHLSEQDSSHSDASSPTASKEENLEDCNKINTRIHSHNIFSWKNIKKFNFRYKSLRIFPGKTKRIKPIETCLPLHNLNSENEQQRADSASSSMKIYPVLCKCSSEPNISSTNFTKDWFLTNDDGDSLSWSSESESFSGESNENNSEEDTHGIPSDLSYIINAEDKDKVDLFTKYMKKNRNDSPYKFYLCDEDVYDEIEDDYYFSNVDSNGKQFGRDVPTQRRLKRYRGSLSESSTNTVIPFMSNKSTENGKNIIVSIDESVAASNELKPSVLCISPGSLPDINLDPCPSKLRNPSAQMGPTVGIKEGLVTFELGNAGSAEETTPSPKLIAQFGQFENSSEISDVDKIDDQNIGVSQASLGDAMLLPAHEQTVALDSLGDVQLFKTSW